MLGDDGIKLGRTSHSPFCSSLLGETAGRARKRIQGKAINDANGTAESLPDLMQPVEIELENDLDSHLIPL